MRLHNFVLCALIYFTISAFSIAPTTKSGTGQQSVDSTKRPKASKISVDTVKTSQNAQQNIQQSNPQGNQQDNSLNNSQGNPQDNSQNNLQIDTAIINTPQQTIIQADTVTKLDSSLIEDVPENTLTNTKLSIYILLSVLGLALFFYIFVITLFKTFHKSRSTRQSLLLSWNLFFILSIIWIFIIWGLVAGFWTTASFMIVVIFLFIISLIMTIIAIKSK